MPVTHWQAICHRVDYILSVLVSASATTSTHILVRHTYNTYTHTTDYKQQVHSTAIFGIAVLWTLSNSVLRTSQRSILWTSMIFQVHTTDQAFTNMSIVRPFMAKPYYGLLNFVKLLTTYKSEVHTMDMPCVLRTCVGTGP